MGGWIAFWAALVVVNIGTLISHISDETEPWFSVAGLVMSAIMLGYNVGRWLHDE